MRSYHAAGSLPLASEAFLAEAETFITESFVTLAKAEAFLAEAEAFVALAKAEAESVAEAVAEAFLAEEGLVVPAANDTTGWRHTGHVVCGFTVVLANHRRMHAV